MNFTGMDVFNRSNVYCTTATTATTARPNLSYNSKILPACDIMFDDGVTLQEFYDNIDKNNSSSSSFPSCRCKRSDFLTLKRNI